MNTNSRATLASIRVHLWFPNERWCARPTFALPTPSLHGVLSLPPLNHLRAVGNGLIANLDREAINRALGKNLAMLTDREILIGAGMDGRFKRVTLVGGFDFQSLVTAAP